MSAQEHQEHTRASTLRLDAPLQFGSVVSGWRNSGMENVADQQSIQPDLPHIDTPHHVRELPKAAERSELSVVVTRSGSFDRGTRSEDGKAFSPTPSSNSTSSFGGHRMTLCVYFTRGYCRNGETCRFTHDLNAAAAYQNNPIAFESRPRFRAPRGGRPQSMGSPGRPIVPAFPGAAMVPTGTQYNSAPMVQLIPLQYIHYPQPVAGQQLPLPAVYPYPYSVMYNPLGPQNQIHPSSQAQTQHPAPFGMVPSYRTNMYPNSGGAATIPLPPVPPSKFAIVGSNPSVTISHSTPSGIQHPSQPFPLIPPGDMIPSPLAGGPSMPLMINMMTGAPNGAMRLANGVPTGHVGPAQMVSSVPMRHEVPMITKNGGQVNGTLPNGIPPVVNNLKVREEGSPKEFDPPSNSSNGGSESSTLPSSSGSSDGDSGDISGSLTTQQMRCRYFSESGGCWYGDACRFSHQKE
ncbi:hypothetical protein M427DRAFT_136509 [Gonapodya prolifera JEL478]|uniref:C3H1-type domain-containing protein n=1 Tax=Gonapodya prolifera (strain JEL478) TaxID=1344416 RepID=A0A139A9R0_GONPJ|nr:hypothetical protein M427DRAFT_136509 [Gonapodya prolifera JEL478]|eukprot:KXS13506.1 hypothetical protein M427DRAFT_136509 [Gonapodya prolifera JEL478]